MTWEVLPLAEVAEVRLGRQRSPKNHQGKKMRPYLRAANVGWSGLLLNDVKSMNFTDAEMITYRLHPGDIVLSEASGSPGEVGKPALWTGELDDCAFQNTLIRVRPTAHEPRFLLHYFRYVALTGGFLPSSRGVGINHLGRARLAGWPTPLPSTAEQRRIVEILEDHLSRLDAAADYASAADRRLARLRDQVVMDAITGRHEAGARTAVFPEPAGTADGDLPELPYDWRWRRLGEIAEVVGGVTKDAKKQNDPAFVEVPYLRVANVQRGMLRLDDVTSIRVAPTKVDALRLMPGDVLMNEGGDRDKLARGWVWEGQIDGCIHQNHVFRARAHEGIDPYFLSWCANTIGGRWAERNGKQSVNLASISLSMIRKMPVIVPPFEVAQRIVADLHDRLRELDQATASITALQTRTAGLRRSVLTAAFKGQLTGGRTDDEAIEEFAGAMA